MKIVTNVADRAGIAEICAGADTPIVPGGRARRQAVHAAQADPKLLPPHSWRWSDVALRAAGAGAALRLGEQAEPGRQCRRRTPGSASSPGGPTPMCGRRWANWGWTRRRCAPRHAAAQDGHGLPDRAALVASSPRACARSWWSRRSGLPRTVPRDILYSLPDRPLIVGQVGRGGPAAAQPARRARPRQDRAAAAAPHRAADRDSVGGGARCVAGCEATARHRADYAAGRIGQRRNGPTRCPW